MKICETFKVRLLGRRTDFSITFYAEIIISQVFEMLIPRRTDTFFDLLFVLKQAKK